MNLITVKFDKYGEMDFGINARITDFTAEEMNKLRAITCVAIGISEDMWRRSMEDKAEKPQQYSLTN